MPDIASGESPPRARRVLVPVSNPETAPGLLHLAWTLADRQQGHVIALYVTLGDTEIDDDAIEELSKIVERERGAGVDAELMTRSAPTVARGILEVAREQGVSLVVLGFQAGRGEEQVGPIVDSVARTAPYDLVVFRSRSRQHVTLDEIKRVVMPLDGSDNARVAARMGVQLAEAYQAEPVAIYVQTDPRLPTWHGQARIDASLARLSPDDARRVRRQVVVARDVVQALAARVDEHDLVVIGFSERSPRDRWILGDVPQETLASAPGPVIVVKQAISEDSSEAERMGRRLLAQFSPRLTPAERTEVQRRAAEMSLHGINFYVLMVFSALLASFGVLQNNVGVIIGAMLVAPMRDPLMAFAAGLVQGHLRLMRDAAVTVVFGIGIGLLVSAGLGLVYPIDVPTREMLAWGKPSLLDMGVALAAGAVGAYALARKDIASVLAGVAVAVSLVPPLCTIGLALAFGDETLALGSSLLFASNIVSISLAGAAIFVWLGIRPIRTSSTLPHWVISLAVLALLAVPLARAFVEVIRLEQQTSTTRNVLAEQFEGGEVLEVELTAGDPYEVRATIRSVEWLTSLDVQEAQDALRDALGQDVALELTNVRAIEP